MSEILKKNLETLFQRYPNYRKTCEKYLELEDMPPLKETFELRGDSGTLTLLEFGKLLDSSSLTFPSLEPSRSEVYPRLLLVGGFGLGRFLEVISESPLKSYEELIVVEPSMDQFLFIANRVPLHRFIEDKRNHFVIGMTSDEAFSMFMQILRTPETAFRMDAYRILEHPILAPKHRRYFDQIWDEWKAAQMQIRRHFGTVDDSLVGLHFVVENLPWIKSTPGVLSLKGKFRGVSAVIVSTGPSLDKSLDDLKRIQHKALLLAADASLTILLENGIQPHFVLSLERDCFSKKFFMKASSLKPDLQSNLVSYPLVPRESTQEYMGPQWVVYRDLGYFFFLEDELPRGIIPSSSSVAHFCLRFADYLSCSIVGLVGQDLAFDPDHLHSHAQGIVYEEWAQKSSMDALLQRIEKEQLGHLVWVEGNFRPRVPTHSVYFSFMKEFSWEATQVSMPVFNCTEGGAKIPGVSWKKLSDLSEDWSDPFILLAHSAILGAAIEFGIAMGYNGRRDVYVVLDDERSSIFYAHPAVQMMDTIDELRKTDWY
jgi:hypothetical protein